MDKYKPQIINIIDEYIKTINNKGKQEELPNMKEELPIME